MKRLLLPSLTALVVVLCLGCVGNTPEATLLKGLEAYRDGDWWGAILYFQRYVEKWPEHAMHNEAFFYLADCNFNAGQAKAAEDNFRRFLEAAPEHAFANRSRLALAMILEENSRGLESEGKAEEAAAAWQEAQDLLSGVAALTDPSRAVLADQATVFLANAHFVHGNTAEALDIYEQRLARAERMLARAVLAAETDEPSPVTAAAALADPTHAHAWFHSLQQIASIASIQKDWEKARACHARILAATFIPPGIRLGNFLELAVSYRQEDRIPEAVETYRAMREAIAAEEVEMATTLHILSNRFIADTYIHAGSPEDATAVLDPIYEYCRQLYRQPGEDREMAVYAGINLAEIELIRGDSDAAERTLTQVLLDYPNTSLTILAEQKLRQLRAITAEEAAAASAEALIAPSLPPVAETVEAASP